MSGVTKFQQYGLKEALPPIPSFEDLLEEAYEIEKENEESSFSQLAEETGAANNVIGVLDNIAKDAEIGTGVAVESLNYALTAVLNSHGAKLKTTSLENLSNEDASKQIIAKANDAIGIVRKDLSVTTEDYLSDIRYNINSKLNLVIRAQSTLNQSLSAIEHKRKHIEENGVDVNYHGIYDFLHREGRLVPDLGDCLKPDIIVLQNLKKVLLSITEDMKHQLLHINPRDKNALSQFCKGVRYMNFGGKLNSVNGYRLLNNGRLNLVELCFDEEGDIETSVLEVAYDKTSNDGSKNTLKENIKSGILVGLPFMIGGAIAGTALGGAIGGVAGGVLAGAGGAYMGVQSSDHKMRGTETTNNIALNSAIAFIDDAVIISQGQKDLQKMLDIVTHDISIIRGLAKEILKNVDDNLILTILINTLGQIATDQINSKKGEGEEKIEYQRVKSNKEIAQELLDDYVTSLYYSYVSVLDVLVDHSFVCIKNTLEVASRLSK